MLAVLSSGRDAGIAIDVGGSENSDMRPTLMRGNFDWHRAAEFCIIEWNQDDIYFRA